MKQIFFFCILAASAFLMAQTSSFQLIHEYRTAENTIRYEFIGDINVGSSPNQFSLYNGRYLYIPQWTEGLLFDVVRHEYAGAIPYLPGEPAIFFQKELPLFFAGGQLVFTGRYPLLGRYDLEHQSFPENSFVRVRATGDSALPVLFYDYVVFKANDIKLFAVNYDGTFLNNQALISLQQSWLNNTYYPLANLRDSHARITNRGEYPIVDGIAYPWTLIQLEQYFSAIGKTLERPRDLTTRSNAADCYYSLNGDIYCFADWRFYVFDQNGKHLITLDTRPFNMSISAPRLGPTGSGPQASFTPFYFLIHPNGDIYTYQHEPEFRVLLHRATRTWGTDYIARARAGCTQVTEQLCRSMLQAFNNPELRIMRHALFAIHGWQPVDWQMRNYFLGYDWYQPDPAVRMDPAILTEPQRRLYALVQAEETRRGWPDQTVACQFDYLPPGSPLPAATSPATPAPAVTTTSVTSPSAPGTVPSTVRLAGLSASSTLTEPADLNAYHPAKVFDGKADTGWFEAVAGPGLGQWLEVGFTEPLRADRLTISPGWLDARYWHQNNRIRTVSISVDGGTPMTFQLTDTMASQIIQLPRVLTGRTWRFRIDAVYPNTRWDDTTITELGFWLNGVQYRVDLGTFAAGLQPRAP